MHFCVHVYNVRLLIHGTFLWRHGPPNMSTLVLNGMLYICTHVYNEQLLFHGQISLTAWPGYF